MNLVNIGKLKLEVCKNGLDIYFIFGLQSFWLSGHPVIVCFIALIEKNGPLLTPMSDHQAAAFDLKSTYAYQTEFLSFSH
jgi:hypothetical protein